MKKILWLSLAAPYDTVAHASGQTENYYIKYLARSGFSINLVSFCKAKECDKLDVQQYGIEDNIIVLGDSLFDKIVRTLRHIERKYNYNQKYAGLLDLGREKAFVNKLYELLSNHYKPDLIVLEWTEIVLLVDYIKCFFPNIPIVAIEEDVAYLGYERKVSFASKGVLKRLAYQHYKKLKELELNALNKVNIVITNNSKDSRLLIKDGIDKKKIFMWNVFYHNMLECNRSLKKSEILFFGAMDRPENYLSAIWFIEKVMPLITDLDVSFIVLGSNPPKKLRLKQSERIIVTGFVKKLEPYFEKSMCLVAPLILGAGVKVKILEALTSGIPILTNSIGIEGIDAVNGREYFHCESPQDYERIIRKIYNDEINSNEIGKNAKAFMRQNYSLENSALRFKELVCNLTDK